MSELIIFTIGLVTGGLFGISIMCILQVSKKENGSTAYKNKSEKKC